MTKTRAADYVRTRMTQDFDTHSGGHTYHHQAVTRQIAVNNGGTLTVVYGMQVTPWELWLAGPRLHAAQRQLVVNADEHSRHRLRDCDRTRRPRRQDLSRHFPRHEPCLVLHERIGFLDARDRGKRSPCRPCLAHDLRRQADARLHQAGPARLRKGLDEHRAIHPRDGCDDRRRRLSQPSVKINPNNEWQMIVWAQADGTRRHRNADGWGLLPCHEGQRERSSRIRHERPSQDRCGRRRRRAVDRAARQRLVGALSESTCTTSLELGGIGFGAEMEISYVRGAEHLYWIASSTGC